MVCQYISFYACPAVTHVYKLQAYTLKTMNVWIDYCLLVFPFNCNTKERFGLSKSKTFFNEELDNFSTQLIRRRRIVM